MGQLPLYKFDEDQLSLLASALTREGLELVCVQPVQVQNDNVTMYQGWEIKRGILTEVIMWAKYSIHRQKHDRVIEVTLGSPLGKRGLVSVQTVERILHAFGGEKIA